MSDEPDVEHRDVGDAERLRVAPDWYVKKITENHGPVETKQPTQGVDFGDEKSGSDYD